MTGVATATSCSSERNVVLGATEGHGWARMPMDAN